MRHGWGKRIFAFILALFISLGSPLERLGTGYFAIGSTVTAEDLLIDEVPDESRAVTVTHAPDQILVPEGWDDLLIDEAPGQAGADDLQIDLSEEELELVINDSDLDLQIDIPETETSYKKEAKKQGSQSSETKIEIPDEDLLIEEPETEEKATESHKEETKNGIATQVAGLIDDLIQTIDDTSNGTENTTPETEAAKEQTEKETISPIIIEETETEASTEVLTEEETEAEETTEALTEEKTEEATEALTEKETETEEATEAITEEETETEEVTEAITEEETETEEATEDLIEEETETEEATEALTEEETETEEATEALTEEETEEETETELSYPEQKFTGSTANVRVEITAPEGAFPDGTSMTLTEVFDDQTMNQIVDAASEAGTRVDRVHAVDITFRDKEGTEIEPLIPISVKMVSEKIGKNESAKVVHVDDAGNAEPMNDVEVQPQGSKAVAELTEQSTGTAAVQMPTADTAAQPEETDLTLPETDPQTAAAVTETIDDIDELDLAAAETAATLQPVTAPDNMLVGLPSADMLEDQSALEFETDAFSVYAIVYTVDFTFGGFAYSIKGGSSILLSDLATVLGLGEGTGAEAEDGTPDTTPFDVKDVDQIYFTDETLVEIQKIEQETTIRALLENMDESASIVLHQYEDTVAAPDYLLVSLQPFQTEETLTIEMTDGRKYIIDVTDAQGDIASLLNNPNKSYTINQTKDAFKTDPAYSRYYNSESPFGVAGSFHLVVFNKAELQTHVNGNILAKEVISNNQNFGTNNYPYELTYIQKYTKVAGVSASNTNHILVIGSENTVGLIDNNNSLSINDTKLDSPNNLVQDEDTANRPFIDLAAVKAECQSISQYMASQGGVRPGDLTHSDIEMQLNTANSTNEITLKDPDTAGYVYLSGDEVNNMGGESHQLNIKGFSSGHLGSVVINVDCAGMAGKVLDLPNSPVYIDGKEQSTGELTEFSSGKVVWNFINCDGIKIITHRMTGAIMAPGATVDIHGNTNGPIICDNLLANAESHRTDFTGKLYPTSTGFTAYKTLDGRTPQSNEIFTFELYEWKNTNGSYSWNLVQTKENKGGSINFDPVPYSEAGEHWYRIVEKAGNDETIDYSKAAYYVKVPVTKNGNVVQVGTKEYYQGTAESIENLNYGTDSPPSFESQNIEEENVVFENKTREVPEAELKAYKTVNGRTPEEDEVFTFKLEKYVEYEDQYQYGWPTVSRWDTVMTADNVGGEVAFKNIPFSAAGNYLFRITEVKDESRTDVQYSEAVYYATAVVNEVIQNNKTTYRLGSIKYYSDINETQKVYYTWSWEGDYHNGRWVRKTNYTTLCRHDDAYLITEPEVLFENTISKPVSMPSTGGIGTKGYIQSAILLSSMLTLLYIIINVYLERRRKASTR